MNKETKTNGVGFLQILALMFIYLKLTNQIDWGWFMVLAPLWLIPVAIFATGFILGILSGITDIIKGKKK